MLLFAVKLSCCAQLQVSCRVRWKRLNRMSEHGLDCRSSINRVENVGLECRISFSISLSTGSSSFVTRQTLCIMLFLDEQRISHSIDFLFTFRNTTLGFSAHGSHDSAEKDFELLLPGTTRCHIFSCSVPVPGSRVFTGSRLYEHGHWNDQNRLEKIMPSKHCVECDILLGNSQLFVIECCCWRAHYSWSDPDYHLHTQITIEEARQNISCHVRKALVRLSTCGIIPKGYAVDAILYRTK